ncbi:unnamed protein product [Acanthoscelides obtectus]|uniref:Conserved oligomeric Golgi complex subunit 8 n=1 Tax=Acanthoscelides obtectus TaxID=200917 RepID=A0A9P0JPF0_ACAOB|nr:unnamed protein product [Acanthoscelides obtectus]CAH1957242.1 unnamed protein product [Acanthoscelides obtectus]CAH1957243.1 unnamed protein product [Acanthoscelides obtectus]CAK1642856.1 Conserved oligomeric Golgi complex subunit 8 [Acanthoscelides obtectus]CAK1642858.1 Conserved oligomeric Golgi complex subunit 8 [Acanthoscelides obtectus]
MTDYKRFLSLLYPDGYPAQWEDDPKIRDYILKLGTYHVDNLVREPDRLKHEAASLQEHIQELAVSNYRTFIETAECSRELFSQFNSIECKLDMLLSDIPKFEEKCKEFGEKSGDINEVRRLNSLTLSKSLQLLEVLELPQLMNSFINDGLYEDALELAAYVRKIYNKHSNIVIFKSIVDDVDKAWLTMLHQLLTQLRQDLSLPKCLQIVGYLRRMQVFSETELRLKFLQTRSCWLDECLRNIPKDDMSNHLTKTIDVTRVNLFNILTQYRAIFNDDEHSPLVGDSSKNQNVIFYCWIKDKISQFLVTLKEDLKYISSIESILEQCMYFGLSFSKVGCDFRSQMIPIFTSRISENFNESITDATKNFEQNMEKFTLIDKIHPSIPWKSKSEDQMQPPDSLLEFYPLGEYLNNVLNVLNKLRLCAPVAVADDVVSSLQDSLTVIAKSLQVLYNQEQQALTHNSKEAFTRMCMSFADDLVPYIQKCIHIIYPPSHLAAKLGVTVQYLHEDGITFLNKQAVIEPMRHLLPAKVVPDSHLLKDDMVKNEDEGVLTEEKVCDNNIEDEK